MKTAICYYSRHHGNTLKVLEAMAQEGEIDLIDVTTCQTVEEYARHHDAQLTVMEGGEHWFHTPEQLAVLREWEEAET